MELEKSDIQGIVFSGYAKNPSAAYVLLEVVDAARARAWLGRIADALTAGKSRDYGATVNLAVTARGLSALGLPDAVLATFAQEFTDGMAADDHRSRILGDIDESDPAEWRWGGRQKNVHFMLMLYAPDDASLGLALAQRRSEYDGAVREVFVRDTITLPERREHFGFADGIAQPVIVGSSAEVAGKSVIKAGEFVLGYPNEYDKLPLSPAVAAALDTEKYLHASTTKAGFSDLGRNGTYLVVRQLEQRVEEFWNAMAEYSKGTSGQVDKEEAIRLASKCVGRWPSGAPLVRSGDRDDPKYAEDDDFMYAKEDPRGLLCPIGSHIRRTNPRDSLEPSPEESLRVVDRHRIIRRGRSYGKPLAPFARDTSKTERGLFFVCVNTNIRRQFEFIQQTWSNNRKFAGLYEDKDPLIGDQPAGGGTYTIPEVPVRRRLDKLSRFVRVRGGEYFFLPSIRAVRFLGSLNPASSAARVDAAFARVSA